MNHEQLEWAMSHDWYDHFYPTVTGTYMVVTKDGLHFDDFQSLREWAGY